MDSPPSNGDYIQGNKDIQAYMRARLDSCYTTITGLGVHLKNGVGEKTETLGTAGPKLCLWVSGFRV